MNNHRRYVFARLVRKVQYGLLRVATVLLLAAALSLIGKGATASATASVSMMVTGYSGYVTVTTSNHSMGNCTNRAGEYITISSYSYKNCSGNSLGTPDGMSVYAVSVPSGYHVVNWTLGGYATNGSVSCGSSSCYLNYGDGWSNIYLNLAQNYQAPSAPYLSLDSRTDSSATLEWSSGGGGSGYITGYTLFKNGSRYANYSSGSRSARIDGLSCNTRYSFYVRLSSSNGGVATSNTINVQTSDCPAPPPPPPDPDPQPKPKPSSKSTKPSSPTHSTSPSTPSNPTSPTGGGSSSGGSKPKTAKPKPPAAPTGFTATPQEGSDRIELIWNTPATSATIHYKLERSTDNKKWIILADDIYWQQYSDMDTDYSTKYYYRLRAIDDDSSLASKTVKAVATSSEFAANAGKGQDLTLHSEDGIFTAVISTASLGQPANCSFATLHSTLPEDGGFRQVVGPYGIVCQLKNGEYIDHFLKPIQASVDESKLDLSDLATAKLVGYIDDSDLANIIPGIVKSNDDTNIMSLTSTQLNYMVIGKPKVTPLWIKIVIGLAGFVVAIFAGLVVLYRLRVRAERQAVVDRQMDYWRQEHGF